MCLTVTSISERTFCHKYMSLTCCCYQLQHSNVVILYAVQQDPQSVSMSEFYPALMLARHVLDLIGPSSGAFYKLYSQIWYVL